MQSGMRMDVLSSSMGVGGDGRHGIDDSGSGSVCDSINGGVGVPRTGPSATAPVSNAHGDETRAPAYAENVEEAVTMIDDPFGEPGDLDHARVYNGLGAPEAGDDDDNAFTITLDEMLNRDDEQYASSDAQSSGMFTL